MGHCLTWLFLALVFPAPILRVCHRNCSDYACEALVSCPTSRAISGECFSRDQREPADCGGHEEILAGAFAAAIILLTMVPVLWELWIFQEQV